MSAILKSSQVMVVVLVWDPALRSTGLMVDTRWFVIWEVIPLSYSPAVEP